MKVLFDHQIFSLQQYGGISRYFFELMQNLERSRGVEILLPLLYSDNFHLKGNSRFDHAPFANAVRFNLRKRLRHAVSKRKLLKDLDQVRAVERNRNREHTIQVMKKQDFDIFHPTYFDAYFLDYLNGKPFVLTVPDTIHERFPCDLLKQDADPGKRRRLCENASAIIALSQNTKEDIAHYFQVDTDKINVIYPGLTDLGIEAVPFALPERYILFVGRRDLYKNFLFFMKAISPLLQEEEDLHLFCAGGGGFSTDEEACLKRLGIHDRVLQYDISDRSMGRVYGKALVFAFPSLYEGFGIPLLEAFSMACPVVLSQASCFQEVAGSAGLYFDPSDEPSIYHACKKMIHDRALREAMIQRGTERAKAFSWAQCGKETEAVYRSIAHAPGSRV